MSKKNFLFNPRKMNSRVHFVFYFLQFFTFELEMNKLQLSDMSPTRDFLLKNQPIYFFSSKFWTTWKKISFSNTCDNKSGKELLFFNKFIMNYFNVPRVLFSSLLFIYRIYLQGFINNQNKLSKISNKNWRTDENILNVDGNKEGDITVIRKGAMSEIPILTRKK